MGEHVPLGRNRIGDFAFQLIAKQIRNPHRVCSANLIAIARADAPVCCSNALTSNDGPVGCFVLNEMPGHHYVCSFADHQIFSWLDSSSFQSLYLLDQHVRLYHDAGCDDVGDLTGQDSRGYMVKFVDLAPANHGMSSIRAPLVADDDIVSRCEQINKFAFRFVSPLKSDYTGRCHKIHFQNR